tara:strand:+ start:312 stop:1559 length:1248 start_codon:yes stop_codon:yes gene_type:complete
MPKKSKSKLLFVGSAGCAFEQIPCKSSGKQGRDKKEKGKRSKKKRVTKVMFEPRSADKELRMNKLVRKIASSESWAITWDEKCTSPDYQKLEQISDMNECIAKKNKMRERKQSLRKSRSKTSSRRKLLARSKKLIKQKNYQMLQGIYGGIPASEMMLRIFQGSSDFDNRAFLENFQFIFQALQPLFLGISELQKHGYCHNDLLSRNVLFDEKTRQFKMIDFGLSFDINQVLKDIRKFKLNRKPRYEWTELLKKKSKYSSQVFMRMTKEFLNDRIYSAYPFDYLYFGITKQEIESEIDDIETGFHLIHYEDYYEFIHKGIFHRNIDDLRLTMLDNIMDLKIEDILRKVDVYSLGMLVFELLIDVADALVIPDTELLQLFKMETLKPYLHLLRDMTEFNPRKRISGEEAYKRYMRLI